MEINSQKTAVKIFEFAFQVLEGKANEGIQNLKKLKDPGNVVHLKDVYNNDEIGVNTLLASQSIPAIVLLSLAIEQALKVLIKQENNTPKQKHELRILFGQLSQPLQGEIISFVTSDLSITEEAFEDFLLENNDTFINWRYFYEKQGSASLNFLKSFFDSLKIRIQD